VLAGNDLKANYKNFVNILESIVAHHKRYGGKENSTN
jgi:CRISPR/Cas system CSM-associated protein Csm2 small subunit